MSRIGKRPIPIPNKVTVDIDGATVTVKGPKGTLQRTLPTAVAINKHLSVGFRDLKRNLKFMRGGAIISF